MPAESDGTPRSWTPKDGSLLAAKPELKQKVDTLFRSIELASQWGKLEWTGITKLAAG